MARSHSVEETEQLLGHAVLDRSRVKKKLLAVFSVVVVVTVVVITLAASWVQVSPVKTSQKRNVILMISDGFGPAQETLGRTFYQYVYKKSYNFTMPLDEILVGTMRTRSSDSLVTDSAAGATAFSCAIKTYNGAIALDPKKVPCGTVLESAKARGFATGLVVTSRITHATPAVFSAHVENRDMEDDIARHQIGDYSLGRQVDLMFGGGRCFFLPNSTVGSCREDNLDVLAMAKKNGFKYLQTRQEFDKIQITKDRLPLLGLFTLDHMSYEIDRQEHIEPALYEMSAKALQLLEEMQKDSDKGFFLMIEGSRIDMAAHSNDPAGCVHDILAYQKTIETVRKYVESHPDTVLISTSDHETGGLSLSRQLTEEYPEYLWYPDALARVKNSAYNLSMQLLGYNKDDKQTFIKNSIVRDGLGISDPSEDELKKLNKATEQLPTECYLGDMISKRAQLGWATHGHSAVDVNIYAHGTNAEELRGNHENTDIGNFIIKFLDLDLNEITHRLNKDNSAFHVDKGTRVRRFTDNLAHYHQHHSKN